MPRDPSKIYYPPNGTLAVTQTPISSAAYNNYVADMTADANNPRPVIAGGTGGATAAEGRQNIGAGATAGIVDKAAGTYTAAKSDHNYTWRATGAVTVNLTAAATLTAGWCMWVKGDGGAVTVDPNGSEQINGATTLTVANGSSALIICTGSAFRAVLVPGLAEINTAPRVPVNDGAAVTVDFDTITTPGWNNRLLTDDGTVHGPGVASRFYYVQVIETAAGNLIQEAYPYRATTEKKYTRTRFSGTWTVWKQFAYADEIFPGLINGLTLSNNGTDATNDIDIAAGWAASSETVPALMVLSSALTKRLDAAWAVGTNQGGLDTGSIANTTYHIWLIRRPDTGVVDALFSASATSPTMPANYTQKRYLGPIVRASSAIRAFRQSGDTFLWGTKIADRNSTAAFSAALLTLSVPTGINVRPIVENTISCNVSSSVSTYVGNAAAGGVEMQIATTFAGASAGAGTVATPPPAFETDTSGRLYYQATVSGGSFSGNTLNTLGFIFERGR